MNVETTNKILLLVLSVMNGNELLVWRVGGGDTISGEFSSH